MLFNSFAFAVFFPTVLLLYWILPQRWQNRLLLAASYLFYGWWDWRFLSLILISTLVDFNAGLRIRGATDPAVGKRWLMASLATNLGLLGFFKYFNFFSESMSALLGSVGVTASPLYLNIVLPVGISFYTFQTISYTVDIYRGEMEPTRRFFDFALFVAFFPQLVAGPIERARVLLPRILGERRYDPEQFGYGVHLILWGLFKKVYVADNLAPVVDQLFAAQPTAFGTIVASYAFAFQIYCDFSGYSDIARGCAKTMGFELMVNFRHPYVAMNPSDFWRRWHISLSTWLRDYLYIPLGGSRLGTLRTYRNLMLTMLLGGLWHGATWLFVLWGAYQGALLAIHRWMTPILERVSRRSDTAPRPWVRMLKMGFFFQLVCIGWLIFRGQSVAQIWEMVRAVLTLQGPFDIGLALPLLAFVLPLLLVEWLQLQCDREDVFRIPRIPLAAKSAVCAVLVYLLVLHGAAAQSFIYFQF